jgi:hypothetical protein
MLTEIGIADLDWEHISAALFPSKNERPVFRSKPCAMNRHRQEQALGLRSPSDHAIRTRTLADDQGALTSANE